MNIDHFTNSFKFFGAALDALDTKESIDIKQAYLETLATSRQRQIGLKDPYALFRKIAGESIKNFGHRTLGRFMIDSWLCPKPQLSDAELIRPEAFDQFLCNNGFKAFSAMLKQFVEAHIFPERPVMIGVDHSLTGGVLMALSEKVGPEDLGVLVFDAHTDAVPLSIRSGLVEYALEKGLPAPCQIQSPDSEEYYTTGNFLLQLIKTDILLPENLVIVGPADTANNFEAIDDKRVREYVEHHEHLQEMGISIIGREQLKKTGQFNIKKILDQMACSHIYISLDIDVAAQCGVLATRFIELEGTPTSTILKHVSEAVQFMLSGRFSLVGFDIMEIDIHKIGAKLASGLEDQTGDFMKRFITLLVSGFS